MMENIGSLRVFQEYVVDYFLSPIMFFVLKLVQKKSNHVYCTPIIAMKSKVVSNNVTKIEHYAQYRTHFKIN